MRTRIPTTPLVACVLFGSLCLPGPIVPDCSGQEVHPPQGRPAAGFTPALLAERTQRRRAVEAVIWGMPAVNFDLML